MMWKFNRKFRFNLVVVVAILMSSLVNIRDIRKEYKKLQTEPDDIVQFDDRFSVLKDSMPTLGKVGYLRGGKPDLAAFFVAQYSLSPVFVLRGTEPDLIIADMAGVDNSALFFRDNNLTVKEQYGHDLFIVEKAK